MLTDADGYRGGKGVVLCTVVRDLLDGGVMFTGS
jgi:hypothetical protein